MISDQPHLDTLMELKTLTAHQHRLAVGVGHHGDCSVAGSTHDGAIGHDCSSTQEHLCVRVFACVRECTCVCFCTSARVCMFGINIQNCSFFAGWIGEPNVPAKGYICISIKPSHTLI